MNQGNTQFKYVLAVLAFAVFLLVAVSGLVLSSNGQVGHIDCFPVGSHCANPVQHVNNWQKAFTVLLAISVVFVIAIVSFASNISRGLSLKFVPSEPLKAFDNSTQQALSTNTLQLLL